MSIINTTSGQQVNTGSIVGNNLSTVGSPQRSTSNDYSDITEKSAREDGIKKYGLFGYFKERELARQDRYNQAAEKRANEEYDRRMADQRAYDDPSAIAQRYARAGINPLSVLAGSGPVHSSVSAPSPSNVGQQDSAMRDILGIAGNIGSAILSGNPLQGAIGIAQGIANIGHTKATTKNIQMQTEKEYQLGFEKWVNNCFESVMNGNAKSVQGFVAQYDNPMNYSTRYGLSMDENGEVTFKPLTDSEGNSTIGSIDFGGTQKKGDNSISHQVNSWNIEGAQRYEFKNDTYGTYSIYDSSRNLIKKDHEIAALIGGNEQRAEDLSQSFINLWLAVSEGVTNGRQADAQLIQAFAKDLEAEFKYGELYNAKWWVDTVMKGIDSVGSILDIVTKFKGILAKIPTKQRNKRTIQADGNGEIKSITDTVETLSTQ